MPANWNELALYVSIGPLSKRKRGLLHETKGDEVRRWWMGKKKLREGKGNYWGWRIATSRKMYEQMAEDKVCAAERRAVQVVKDGWKAQK